MMKIHKYYQRSLIIILVCMYANMLPCAGISFAKNTEDRIDRGSKRDAYELSLFAPEWVINSTLNQANLSKAIENTRKYNDLENNLKAPRKDNPEADNGLTLHKKRSSADNALPLQKKDSGGVSTVNTADTKKEAAPVKESKDALYGLPYIENPNFLTPDGADKIFQDGIKDPVHIAIPDSRNMMEIWQDGDDLVYDIRDASGNVILDKGKFYSISDNPDNTVRTYLSDIISQPDGTLEAYVSKIGYGRNYDGIFGSSYNAIETIIKITYKPTDGVFKKTGWAEFLTNSTGYYFNQNIYSWQALQWDDYNSYYYPNNPNVLQEYGYVPPGSLPITPAFTDISFEPATSRTYQAQIMHERIALNYAYNSAEPKIDTFGVNSDKSDALNNISAYDSIETVMKRDSFYVTMSKDARESDELLKNNHYNAALADPLSLKTTSTTIEELIGALENKNSRTNIEESLLQAAKAVMEDSAYLDRDTLNEFVKAVELVRTVEDMKGIMREADFQAISKGLLKLVEEQHTIYDDYLKDTKGLYEKLEKLLGITIEDENLPDEYMSLYRVNTLAKKKIAIDLAIERLKAKDEASLTDKEKQALKIDRQELLPLREEYISKLKMAILSFTLDMRGIFKDKSPSSSSKDESGMSTLFLIDHNKNSSAVAR